MPNPAPPARYDLPWKAVLKHAFRDFMDFYFPDLGARIDWRHQPRFNDKELPSPGFNAAPNLMVADILAEVRMLHRGRKALIHVRSQQAHHDPNKLYAAKLHLTTLLFRHDWVKSAYLFYSPRSTG